MGQPGMLKTCHQKWSKRCELKHLSNSRRRKQIVIAQVVASERATAQTNLITVRLGL